MFVGNNLPNTIKKYNLIKLFIIYFKLLLFIYSLFDDDDDDFNIKLTLKYVEKYVRLSIIATAYHRHQQILLYFILTTS